MTFKRLLLAVTLFCIEVTQGVQAVKETASSHIPEKVIDHKPSSENEALVKSIAEKLSISNYHLFYRWGMWEEWLNDFSEQERIYIIGSALSMTQKLYTFDFMMNFAQWALKESSFAQDVLIGAAFMGNTPSLGGLLSIAEELPISYFWMLFCYGLGEDLAMDNPEDSQIKNILFATDAQVAQQLECRDGAISTLTKMHAAASSMQLDTQLLEDRIEKLKALAVA